VFSLKNIVGRFAQRQSLAALGARFVVNDGIAVSVLCLTRNADSYLDFFLAALENQLLPASRFEVLVFDQGSLDDTAEVLARYTQRKRLNLHVDSDAEVESESLAWNRLSAKARGGITMFASDTLIAHPPLLVQHLMAHLEGETLLCGAPIPRVHSHVFSPQALPVPELRPCPVVSTEEENWMESLLPLVCSVEGVPEQPASWLDFDTSHCSMRRESYQKTGLFRGDTPQEDFGNWGLPSRDFALRAQEMNIQSRWLMSPVAWQMLKPNRTLEQSQANCHSHRFFAHHPGLDRETWEKQLNRRLLSSPMAQWA